MYPSNQNTLAGAQTSTASLGSSIGCGGTVKESPSEVQRLLNDLGQSVSVLDHLIEQLSAKLSPALAPTVPSSADGRTPSNIPISPLGIALDDLNRRVHNIRRVVEDTASRIQL